MILETFLILAALPFVGLTIFFGTKGGYYDSDDYTGAVSYTHLRAHET